MGTGENGFHQGDAEFEVGPFRVDTLSGEAAMRDTASRVTAPFPDLESPFALPELATDGQTEAPFAEAGYAREDETSRCPHCGREIEGSRSLRGLDDRESPDFVHEEEASYEEAEEAESPFLAAEDEESESPFLAAEAFDEELRGADAEWEEQEQGLDHVERLFEAESEFASLSPSELKAVRITSTFETGHAGGFGGLTGNMDGQGLSFGLMNWTINAGSLIPMLKEFIREHSDRYAEIFGGDAERFKAMVFATRRDPKSGAQVRDVAAQMDFVRAKMNDAAQKHIVEPWKTYFNGLENDPDFRRIEVTAARKGLAHAKRWFDRFGFKTERGFVFMFDLVSSHGAWWLDAKKFGGKREKLLADRLAQKKAETGRDLTERETMEVIANMIADISLPKWREKVRARKLWFVRGTGKVHGTAYDIDRDFGVTDAAPDFGTASGSAVSAPSPSAPSPSAGDGGLLGSISDALARFRELVQAGQEVLAISEAVRSGQSDVNKLTNLVFFARHPELGGRKIGSDERELVEEWLRIRDALVRPTVARLGGSQPAATPTKPAPAVPAGQGSKTKTFLGLDTASVAGNKDPDWVRARTDAGMSFAIIRSNFGTGTDAVFERDWPKIKDAGMVRGAYLFLRFPHHKYKTCPTPVAQAKALIKTVGKLDESDLPPSLDVEFPGGRAETKMTASQILDGVRAAWTVLKDHYGVAPIIYTSGRVWREDLNNLPAPDLVESPLWLARYPFKKGPARRDLTFFASGRHDPPVPPPWGDATNWWIHQYQGDAVQLPGFPTGNVDMNRFNTMVPGAAGDRVKWVQRRLGMAQSGTFDAATEAALRSFKAKKGLAADAVVDPATFAFLCWS